MNKFARGMDKKEFLEKILPLKDKLFRFAVRLLKNHEDAEDAVQEVYLKLWQKRYTLESKYNLDAFAMTVTRNLCIDKMRENKVTTVQLNENITESSRNNPVRMADMKDIDRKIRKIIDDLPEKQKQVIHLRDIEQYSYDDIAEITGYNKNIIKVNLSRARRNVRDKLKELYNYEYN